MTSSKNTKRALLASVLSVVLCTAMLVGSTFAWFTDSASTSVNRIQAGTLKIDLVNAEGNSLEGKTLGWVAHDGRDQEQILWEPGATYNTEEFYIENKGNLNLKFKFVVSGIDGDAKLLEVIDFDAMAEADDFTFAMPGASYKPGEGDTFDLLKGYDADIGMTGWPGMESGKAHYDEYILEPGEKAGPITVTGHMQESAGNEYQGLSIEGIAITLIATQAIGDEDSFNGVYDEDAEYDEVVVVTPGETPEESGAALQEAITEVENGGTVVVPAGEYTMGAIAIGDKEVVLQGTSDTVLNPADEGLITIRGSENAKLTVRGMTFTGTGAGGARGICFSGQQNVNAELVVENCTFGNLQTGIFLGGVTNATVTGCTFTNCEAGIGGSEDIAGTLTVENCTFDKNTETIGWAGTGKLIITNCPTCSFFNQYEGSAATPVPVENGEYNG